MTVQDGPEPQVRWDVRLDGAPVLEFRGEYPYRDDDVRRRVLEWYGIPAHRHDHGARSSTHRTRS